MTKNEVRRGNAGYSDSEVDGERLAADLQKAMDELSAQGYLVTQVTSVISGGYDYVYQSQGVTSSPRILSDTEAVSGGASFGYGYGFSYTDSLIVVATRNE